MFIWKKERRANSKANIFLESSRKNHTLISENNECFHPFTCAVSVFASNLNWKNPGASAKENDYFCYKLYTQSMFWPNALCIRRFCKKKCTLCLQHVSDSELTNSFNVNAVKKIQMRIKWNEMKQVQWQNQRSNLLFFILPHFVFRNVSFAVAERRGTGDVT